ncbi:MAG: leucine-rich repeat protein [Clostridia bacterium]|nr:leucine-rich repeat protein [Clostridia bacterium]
MEKSKTKVQGKGKRLLAVMLATLTIGSTVVTTGSFTGVGISASAVTYTARSSASDFKYHVMLDGTITIDGYKGSSQNVNIPSKIDGKSVTEINANAFKNSTKITNVTIPDSVKNICYGAFQGCTNLKSVKIGKKVENIRQYAFADCKKLTSIVIPDSVKSTEYRVFENCTNLTDVKIGKNLKSIEPNVFAGCTSLKNVSIGKSVEVINNMAFQNCTSLQSITIPDGVKRIGYNAFESCTALKSVKIPNTVKEILSRAFLGCTNLKNLLIPSSVTNIGVDAFGYKWRDKYHMYTTQIDDCNIYGSKGSQAEKYANKSSIPFFETLLNNSTLNNSKNSNVTINKGKSITLKAVAKGGNPSYKYAFMYKLSTSNSWTTLTSFGTTSTKTWTPSKAGTYKVCARVKDANGFVVDKTFILNVVAPLANTSKISSSTIYKGNSVTITGAATGGKTPYKYSFAVKPSSSKNWTTIQSYSTTAKKTWKPDKTGKYDIRVNVTDGKSTVSKTFTVNVLAPLVNKSTVSNTNVKKGSTITLKAAATGGKSPYKYAFTYRNSNSKTWKTLKAYSSSSTYNAKMNKAGTYYFNIYVKDSTGKSVRKTFTVTVK